MKINRHISKAIKQIGGPVATAEKTGAPSYQSVQSWAASGQVPVKYCLKVEELSGISRKLLRPKDWSAIWPDLAQAA